MTMPGLVPGGPAGGSGDTPWATARVAAYAAPDPLPATELPLAAALSSTLAAPLRADCPLPAFECAAMDGWAVGSAEPPWRVVPRVLAGHPGDLGVAAGLSNTDAAEVATDAAVPPGTVAVLPVEDGVLDAAAGELWPRQGVRVRPGRHVRAVGEDVPAGAELFPATTPVTPTVLGLAASVGRDTLRIHRRPRVVALLTGDGLVAAGRPGGGRVRDAVGPQLPGLLRWLGGELADLRPVRDDPAALAAAVRDIDPDAGDVVLVCGGAGPGSADRVRVTLDGLDARILVGPVACRPGRPQVLARLPDGRWLVALPGNPFAALVGALTLLGPLLTGLSGRRLPRLPTATLASAPPGVDDVPRIVPVRRDGAGTVHPLGHDRPGNLWGAALADSLAVVPPAWLGQPVALLALPAG